MDQHCECSDYAAAAVAVAAVDSVDIDVADVAGYSYTAVAVIVFCCLTPPDLL